MREAMLSDSMTIGQCELWTIRFLNMLAEKLAHGLAEGNGRPGQAARAIARLADGAEHVAQYALDGVDEGFRAGCLARDVEVMRRVLADFSAVLQPEGNAPTTGDLDKLLAAIRPICSAAVAGTN